MQRRRRSKAVPKDIFGNAPNPPQAKKDVVNTPPSSKPVIPRAPTPPPSVEVIENLPSDTGVESDTKEESSEIVEDEVVESQILGVPRRKSIGLRPREVTDVDDKEEEGPSHKAQELIDESKLRSEEEEEKNVEVKVVATETMVEVPKPKTPSPRKRRRRTSFQPAARAKRLDRSRHMEYKYEMRGLLVDIDIPEEHRSNILGTIWARGERLTVADAKEFISEKCEQGVLTEEQEYTLRSVVDRYTVRR